MDLGSVVERIARFMFKAMIVAGVLLLVLVFWLGFFARDVFGQEYFDDAAPVEMHHGHPAADLELHEKFYKTWTMPDHRDYSCCSLEDCYPTETRPGVETEWAARRREDGLWIDVPDYKVEREHQPPDGRAHVCMSNPKRTPIAVVYCFSPPAGM